MIAGGIQMASYYVGSALGALAFKVVRFTGECSREFQRRRMG